MARAEGVWVLTNRTGRPSGGEASLKCPVEFQALAPGQGGHNHRAARAPRQAWASSVGPGREPFPPRLVAEAGGWYGAGEWGWAAPWWRCRSWGSHDHRPVQSPISGFRREGGVEVGDRAGSTGDQGAAWPVVTWGQTCFWSQGSARGAQNLGDCPNPAMLRGLSWPPAGTGSPLSLGRSSGPEGTRPRAEAKGCSVASWFGRRHWASVPPSIK